MAENPLFIVVDDQVGATKNPHTEAETIAIINGTKPKMRWDPDEPLTPGYDAVPISISNVDGQQVATFSIVSCATGKVIADKFKIDLKEREQCHAGPPSTSRNQLSATHSIVILMIGALYYDGNGATADTNRTFKEVAAEAGVPLSAKWPQTESAPIVDAIVEAARADTPVTIDFLRQLYRRQRALNPALRIPRGLGEI